MYEVIKVVDETRIDVTGRQFRFKFTAQRSADRLNAGTPQGTFAAAFAPSPRWQVQDSKTVTAMLGTALEKAQELERREADVVDIRRDTQEIMKAIDAGHALGEKPQRTARKPRGGATQFPTLEEVVGADKAADIVESIKNPAPRATLHRPAPSKKTGARAAAARTTSAAADVVLTAVEETLTAATDA